MQQSIELFQKVEQLLVLLTSIATGGRRDDAAYKPLRAELLAVPRLHDKLPAIVLKSRDTDAFWQFIKQEFGTYAERRVFLRNEFEPALSMLETDTSKPTHNSVAHVISKLNSRHVEDAWRKALDRRNDDPEGAITAARALIESVCKHILDEGGPDKYEDKDDLPKLYGLTIEQLNLSPSQHTEQIFKQILGGCKSVVEGLGALRNKLSDAHGKGQNAIKPSPRHAELAVNLAGSMATFLISTWEARQNQQMF